MSQEIMKSNFILPKKNWWNLKLIFLEKENNMKIKVNLIIFLKL